MAGAPMAGAGNPWCHMSPQTTELMPFEQQHETEHREEDSRKSGDMPLGKRSRHESQLPPGWKSSRDQDGRIYYYNKSTGQSTYVSPLLADDSPPLPPPQQRHPSEPASPSSQLLLSSMANCSHSVVEGGAVSTNHHRRAEINELKARLVYETESSVKAHLHGRIARLETLEGLY